MRAETRLSLTLTDQNYKEDETEKMPQEISNFYFYTISIRMCSSYSNGCLSRERKRFYKVGRETSW